MLSFSRFSASENVESPSHRSPYTTNLPHDFHAIPRRLMSLPHPTHQTPTTCKSTQQAAPPVMWLKKDTSIHFGLTTPFLGNITLDHVPKTVTVYLSSGGIEVVLHLSS